MKRKSATRSSATGHTMPKWPPKPPPGKSPNQGHWRAGRKFPWWKDENRVWSKRRRSGIRQKPWNKPSRIEKFWVPATGMAQGTQSYLISPATTGTPTNVAFIDGQSLTSDQFQTEVPRALQHAKLHRFQGHLWAWLDPQDFAAAADGSPTQEASWAGTGGPGGHILPSNIAMLTYVWLKLKEVANVSGGNTVGAAPGDFNPRPDQDLPNILLRDDVLSWGTMPVFGIVPRSFTAMYSAAAASRSPQVVGSSGMYEQSHVARIPFPRLPKTGMNLRKGEALVCVVANWGGPGAWTTDGLAVDDPGMRGIVVFSDYRMLCSI